MNVEDFVPYYPNINDDTFNLKFTNKKEFTELTLPVTENFPTKKGDKLTHQKLIARIMSSFTPIDSILLLHDMGTGKTCTVISVIERLKREQNGINNFIYIAKNDNLLDKFKSEYIYTCTENDYTEVKWSKLNIKLLTMEKFAKNYSVNTNTFNQLDNTLIIIDEIHNIRDTSSKIYDIYHKILHSIENSKIILLSGTPMMDSANEIASVMNLILPLEEQLPSGVSFDNKFIKDGILTADKSELDVLRKAFKGRVSYVKSMPTSVNKNFIGVKVKTFKHFKLSASVMSDYQTNKYIEVLNVDEGNSTSESPSPAYSNTLQCCDYVSPSGKYGIKAKDNIPFRRDDDIQTKLNLLKKYSSKYHESISNIIDAKNNKKSVFVYNSHVEGGGLEGFANILNNFGFSRVRPRNIPSSIGNRYILLSSKNSKDNELLRKAFNESKNKHGEYIKIVLASAAISEGFSFNNIQIIDIHSPWFNFSKTAQVIARGIRVGSHKDLIMENPSVDIFLRVSIPRKSGLRSIEVDVYKMAEDKDVISKQIEHIIKEEAIDSKLASNRNKRDNKYDYDRECEYTKCDYTSFPNEAKNIEPVDFTTYNIYYPDVQKYIPSVINLYKNHLSRTFKQIYEKLQISENILIIVLNYIIETNIVIVKNQNNCYMREQNDIYYLVDHLHNINSVLDTYYINNFKDETPISIKPEKDTQNIISNILKDKKPYTDKSIKNFNFNTRQLNMYELQSLLEQYLYNKFKLSNYFIQEIDERFRGTYGTIDDTGKIYVWFLSIEFNATSRVLENDLWRDCNEEENMSVIQYLSDMRAIASSKARYLFNNEDPYIGLFKYNRDYYLGKDIQPKDFSLLKVDDIDSTKNESEKSKGMRCSSYTGSAKKQILDNILSKLKRIADERNIDYSSIQDKQLKGKCKLTEFLFEQLDLLVIDYRV
jgi:hypothetical protein